MSDPAAAANSVEQRVQHFFGTSPDEAGNRRRMVFFLIVLFILGIGYELAKGAEDPNRLELIKNFSSAIIWLVGIYVGGSVVAKIGQS